MSNRHHAHPPKETRATKYKKQAWVVICKFFGWCCDVVSNPTNPPNFLIALFTLALVIFAYRAWDESQRGTQALKDQLTEMRNARRPWIAFDAGDIKVSKFLTFSDTGADVTYSVQMKNGGSSLAMGVHVEASLRVAPLPDVAGPIQIVRRTVMRAMGSACTPQAVIALGRTEGRLLLPNESDTVPADSSVKKQQFFFNSSGGDVSVWMPFCIGYMDDEGNPHGTGVLLMYSAATTNVTNFSPTGVIQG